MLSRRAILKGIVSAGFFHPTSAIASINPEETKPVRPWRIWNILNEQRVWFRRVVLRFYFKN